MSKKLVITLIALIYVASLPLIAFKTNVIIEGVTVFAENWQGYKVLVMGWLGIFDGTIAWYANIFLVIGLAALERSNKSSLILSCIGLLTAISALLYTRSWIDENFAKYANVVEWGPGYFLWLSCFVFLVVASSIALRRDLSNGAVPGINPEQPNNSFKADSQPLRGRERP